MQSPIRQSPSVHTHTALPHTALPKLGNPPYNILLYYTAHMPLTRWCPPVACTLSHRHAPAQCIPHAASHPARTSTAPCSLLPPLRAQCAATNAPHLRQRRHIFRRRRYGASRLWHAVPARRRGELGGEFWGGDGLPPGQQQHLHGRGRGHVAPWLAGHGVRVCCVRCVLCV